MWKKGENMAEINALEKSYNKVKNGESVSYTDCLSAVQYNINAIPFIPERFLTNKLCLIALQHTNCFSEALQFIPRDMLTPEFAVDIIEEANYAYFRYLSIECINQKVIVAAVKQNVMASKYIPKEYQTDEIYTMLFDINPKVLKHIETPSVCFSIAGARRICDVSTCVE